MQRIQTLDWWRVLLFTIAMGLTLFVGCAADLPDATAISEQPEPNPSVVTSEPATPVASPNQGGPEVHLTVVGSNAMLPTPPIADDSLPPPPPTEELMKLYGYSMAGGSFGAP